MLIFPPTPHSEQTFFFLILYFPRARELQEPSGSIGDMENDVGKPHPFSSHPPGAWAQATGGERCTAGEWGGVKEMRSGQEGAEMS